jgi:ferrous iron transport protein A
MSSPFPLSELAVGERAIVVEVALAGAYGRRLEDLGFAPDTEVTCRRRAPLGDPRVYEVCGIQLCLRSREAQAIRVRRT